MIGACLVVLLAGCATERVILLPDEDGGHGHLEVRTDGDSVVIDQPLGSATVGLFGGIESAPLDEQQVRREFGAALEAMPPPPSRHILYFREGTTRLVPESVPEMEAFLRAAAADPTANINVVGHTDRVGKVEDNDRLARDRAGFVRKALTEQGLAGRVIRAVGRGEREPLVPTADEVAEPRNRRVEIIVR